MIRTTDEPFPSKLDEPGPPGAPYSALAERARLVLEIVPGERRLLPELGCRLHSLPHLATTAERQLAAACVEEALERWVPALGVERAEVTGSGRGWVDLRLRAGGAWHELRVTHRHAARREEPGQP
jgi:phage baseplate assembly protein W